MLFTLTIPPDPPTPTPSTNFSTAMYYSTVLTDLTDVDSSACESMAKFCAILPYWLCLHSNCKKYCQFDSEYLPKEKLLFMS